LEDCYKILGIRPNATAAEIRRAYRIKAKQLHPDTSRSAETTEEFRALVKAYEILSDVRQRSLFDESFFVRHHSHVNRNADSFDYRTWLLAREDEESRSKLVFFDLMHHREDEAVAEFKRMSMNFAGFRLAKWFTREDFMDYGFILAEELVLRQEYYDAVVLLEQIIRMERSYEYFKLFFPEVMDLARSVLKKQIEGHVSDELALDAWERALELGFGRIDDAYFLRKMAAAYIRMGDESTARICEDEAYRLSA
jgi:curved DNA-binding protein CbpA